MNLSTIQKRLFAWGMGQANDADANRIKLIDCPEYSSLGELKQGLLGNLQHKGTDSDIRAIKLNFYLSWLESVLASASSVLHSKSLNESYFLDRDKASQL